MKFDFTVKSGNEVKEQEKPLSLNTKVDMQTRLTKALQKKQAQNGPAAMEAPMQADGFGRTN